MITFRKIAASAATSILCLSFVTPAQSANTLIVNPTALAFNFNDTAHIADYAQPTGMIIAGRCNRYTTPIQNARASGAEVIAYIEPVAIPQPAACQMDRDFYMGSESSVPRWPYPTSNPGSRTDWGGWPLTDMRAGSAWSNFVVNYIEQLMIEDKVDGVMLDVVGPRLWSAEANWGSWSQTEKDAWMNGNIDLVRRLDERRRAINPRFLIINNNLWDLAVPGDTRGAAGEPYVDGVVLEHHPHTSTYHIAYAGRQFGNLGHRRVISIAQPSTTPGNPNDAAGWANVQGITNVVKQDNYGVMEAPTLPFHLQVDRARSFGQTSVGSTPSAGMTANQKRGSKFTLSEKGTLVRLSAYLDGLGGASGTQSIRLALYRDANGAPGAKVAETSTKTIASGAAASWQNFAAPSVSLDPGVYWAVIHTGDTGALARNYGDPSASNWFGNADLFSDGASDPFGTGSTGTVTLSIYVAYALGHP
jgi:hypothetical protein